MGKVAISIKINVSKIDKERLFSGKNGKYLDATCFIDLDQKDQYDNNGMVTQDVSKEERENGVKGNILGNVSIFWSDNGGVQKQEPQQPAQQNAPAGGGFDDDIPFNKLTHVNII